MRQWEALFKKAIRQLEASRLPTGSWTFGGGTALMLMFNHRHSKDIDIFLPDRQCLAYISPRVNDAAGDPDDYAEQERFSRLYFPEGEIDFIAAPPVTPIRPSLQTIAGFRVHVENPVEIIAKKVAYRADEFTPRDIFDLTVVYSNRKTDLLGITPLLAPRLETLSKRMNILEASGQLEQQLNSLAVLDGGRAFRGHELEICRQCLQDISALL